MVASCPDTLACPDEFPDDELSESVLLFLSMMEMSVAKTRTNSKRIGDCIVLRVGPEAEK
eukprot:scaffold814_cov100-Cylindrotheca_fusiformis.AAC.11